MTTAAGQVTSAENSRRNEIAFACGKKGSGKSKLINDYFAKKFPRVISLDFVGEIKERNPEAIEVVGYEKLVKMIRDLTNSQVEKWQIAAVFDEYQISSGELERLFNLLVPAYTPEKKGLSRILDGLTLECTECDVILPNQGASIAARNMVKRARHEKLNLLFATQRPQECNRLCTSQADWVISFRMHEPREIKYLSDSVSSRFTDEVRLLEQYCSAWYHAETGNVFIRDRDGATIREFTLGDEVDESNNAGG